MPTYLSFTVRKYHKWLSLIIGIQAFLWLASGVYMVIVDLDFIHGDHLVRNMHDPLPSDTSGLVPFAAMRSRFPQAQDINLTTWMGAPYYRVSGSSGAHLLDATTGALRSPLVEADAIAAALYHYTGSGAVIDAVLLNQDTKSPSELQSRPLPLWQIRFDDFGNTSFYISPDQGQLVARRHTFWRIFDFVWMLHIMDYENREDVNNYLFRIAASLGLIMSLFGLWLLYYSFRRHKDVTPQVDSEGTAA